jgi:hypothetical protein
VYIICQMQSFCFEVATGRNFIEVLLVYSFALPVGLNTSMAVNIN